MGSGSSSTLIIAVTIAVDSVGWFKSSDSLDSVKKSFGLSVGLLVSVGSLDSVIVPNGLLGIIG